MTKLPFFLLTGFFQSVQSPPPCPYRSVRALAAAGAYFGMSSVILRMKSDFSAQPLQDSSHSSRIFFRSLTLSFFRSTVVRSSCLSAGERKRKMFWNASGAQLSQTFPTPVCFLTVSQLTDLTVLLLELLTDLLHWDMVAEGFGNLVYHLGGCITRCSDVVTLDTWRRQKSLDKG